MIPEDYNMLQPNEKNSTRGNFEPLPDDTYEVNITKLELKKDQPVFKSTEVEDVFNFEFSVTEEGKFKGRKLWLTVRPIMTAGYEGGQPSWLYKIFCAVNQIHLTDQEAKTVTASNLNEMLGKGLRIVTSQKLKADGTIKNKITNVLPTKELIQNQEPSFEDLPF